MAGRRSFLLLAFTCCVLSEGEKLFDPCNKDDIKCLSEATENFLEKSCNGLPKYDIKPLDPLIIPELKVVVDEGLGLTFEYKNINVTGLKNQKISDFQMDTDKKSVVLKTKADLNFEGELKIIFTKKDNKQFVGPFQASATALGSSQYGYSLTKRGDQEFFDVGPETNTCEIIGVPIVGLGDVLLTALNDDADARDMKPEYEANQDALRKKTLCRIVETAYITVIHNIRAAAKVLPKTAFFKDI